MRAVVVDPGAPGHLAINEVNEPTPDPNEALVRVRAVSLNAGEVKVAQMQEAGARIGWDVAGTVERAAADGSGPREGARVVGLKRAGGWAEFVSVPADRLAALPDNVSFAQAATLPVAGLTALHSIEKGTGLLARNVLVTGASGGVGHFCCQLAKLSGARVTGQVRKDSHRELVEKSGADNVVVSEDASATEQFGPYKLIADAVGGQVLANVLGMLSEDGICVAYGASGGEEIKFNLWSFVDAGRASLYGLLMFDELVHEPASQGLSRLASLIADGRLKPQIALEESWSRVGEVAQEFLDRKHPGKIVLNID